MPDYHCAPLWLDSTSSLWRDADGVGPVEPEELPLSQELRAALWAWAAIYDRTLNDDDPRESGFASAEEETAFEAEGRRLWSAIRAELGPSWPVAYFSQADSSLHR
jgi:hypothetical protein